MTMIETIFMTIAGKAMRELAKPIYDKRKQLTEKLWQEYDERKGAKAYAQKMKERYGTMIIIGKPKPVTLEGVFTDVYVLDRLTANRRYHLDTLRKTYQEHESKQEEEERLNGFAYVQHATQEKRTKDTTNKLFILGKPGAGKTTFLKYLTLRALAGDMEQAPIFVSLKRLSDSQQSIFDFIVKEFDICGFPDADIFAEQLLAAGQALLLFDGLDEVPQAQEERTNLITNLNDFTDKYNQCPAMITCRIAATDYRFSQFTYLEMADFTWAQVKSFAGKWFEDNPEKRDLFLKELNKEEHASLKELARTPILLNLLCLSFEDNQAFHPERAEIYEDALDILLRKWDSARNIQRDKVYKQLSVKRKKQLLAEIAMQTFSQEEYFIPRRRLINMIESFWQNLPQKGEEEVDGAIILQAMIAQHGLFVERAKSIYSFSHLTFQEYFTARYIVDNEARGTLKHMIQKGIGDRRWREVFLLTASLLDNANNLFELFLHYLTKTIVEHSKILNLIRWTNKKAKSFNGENISLRTLRTLYLTFDCALAFDLDINDALVLDSVDIPAHSRSLILARANALIDTLLLDQALNCAVAQTVDHTQTRILDLDQALDLDLDSVFDLDDAYVDALDYISVIEPILMIDLYLYFMWKFMHIQANNFVEEFLKKSIKHCQKLGFTNLQQQLQLLTIPEKYSNQWQQFNIAFKKIILKERQLGQNWQLTKIQYESLATYLEGNQLLIECLNIAVVSDRQGIEERILFIDSEE